MGKVIDTIKIKPEMKHIRLDTPAPRVETMINHKTPKYKQNYLESYEDEEF